MVILECLIVIGALLIVWTSIGMIKDAKEWYDNLRLAAFKENEIDRLKLKNGKITQEQYDKLYGK